MSVLRIAALATKYFFTGIPTEPPPEFQMVKKPVEKEVPVEKTEVKGYAFTSHAAVAVEIDEVPVVEMSNEGKKWRVIKGGLAGLAALKPEEQAAANQLADEMLSAIEEGLAQEDGIRAAGLVIPESEDLVEECEIRI